MSTELKVLSAVCKNKDVAAILGEDATLFGPFGDVFESIRNYYYKYKTVPEFSVIQERHEGLEPLDVDGHTAHYLEQLKSEFLGNRMQQIMLKAARAQETDSPQRVLEKMQTELAKLGRYTSTVRDLNLTDAEAAQEHFQKLREYSEAHSGVPGIPTGWDSIDSAYTTGMAPGHFLVLMGYTSRGKSMFADLLATKAWGQGYKPMIISLEMSPEEQRERIYAMMSRGAFRISELSRGDIDLDDFRTWSGRELSGKQDFVIVSNTGIQTVTPNVIQAKIDTHKPDIVFLDYMQLMMDNAKTQAMTPRMLNLSRELKLLAVSNNIPIVAITAVTDEEHDKRDSAPVLSQIAWSSGIEYDANLAIAIHRIDDSDYVEVIGRKNRNGSLFDFYFKVDFDAGIWEEKHTLEF